MKIFQNTINRFGYYVMVLMTGVFTFSSVAFAGGETPVSDGLRYITNALYGATGVSIATISVMIVGVLCLIHLLRWTALAYTIIGMSLIFGAGSVVNGITSLVHNY
jgi:type IV secretory pathway VirB2 component (pilin)